MSDQSVEVQREASSAGARRKKEIGLPLAALALTVLPLLLIFGALPLGFLLPRILLLPLAPVAGFVLGIVALCRGRERIGGVGKALAIIAVALPVSMAVAVGALFMSITAVSRAGGM